MMWPQMPLLCPGEDILSYEPLGTLCSKIKFVL